MLRLLRSGAALSAAALLLTGCQSASPEEETSAGGDFEPVEIEHALGTATITEEPERIVTLGQGSTETAIALGTIPVGMEEYPWGSDETGYMPWIHEAVTEAGGELPEQFTGAEELDAEAIAALDPDLILAPWSGLTQEQYDAISQIAPTVAYPELPWTITWEEQITTIGAAMGQDEEAAGLIEDIEAQFAAASRPEYEGITFSFIYTTGPGTLGVFMPTEQRVAMVSALGLTVDPVAETLEETEGTDSALLSLENADVLADSDLIFTFYSDPGTRQEIESQAAYAAIPAIARGSVVAPEDQPFVTGSSMINPLTVPWALERYVPMIDEAIDKLDD
ncbi:iron-siderophore ABC transporter substrate-binding protein [Sediminivirga luteola]|uniref:Iron-siderophore ABC transporter substrate-binding protein n=1 Tax=Sediminivirga luteola TaxID=1774748 RepID=A0A8J2XJM1_9MICO|nr:iron-siderophore ABC transporter substrate-binding protein [Sediminivirga luteola]MCI2266531.1 iron-siderophore ABC transporter substrate-binding protein [Sediminivirga luteola]GGA07704.1 iron-siderophore ABC transporter substrate-binding protein [Sediminivirga luteola]